MKSAAFAGSACVLPGLQPHAGTRPGVNSLWMVGCQNSSGGGWNAYSRNSPSRGSIAFQTVKPLRRYDTPIRGSTDCGSELSCIPKKPSRDGGGNGAVTTNGAAELFTVLPALSSTSTSAG